MCFVFSRQIGPDFKTSSVTVSVRVSVVFDGFFEIRNRPDADRYTMFKNGIFSKG